MVSINVFHFENFFTKLENISIQRILQGALFFFFYNVYILFPTVVHDGAWPLKKTLLTLLWVKITIFLLMVNAR